MHTLINGNPTSTFDVVIYEYATGKVSSVIGKAMREDAAEKRVLTGLSRCNSEFGTKTLPHFDADCANCK